MSPDNFFNFAVTAWALRDWAKKDPTLTAGKRRQAAEVENSQWLRMCQDVANGGKHFRITRYEPTVTDTAAESSYGAGRYGKGEFGVGEHSITLEVGDASYNALDVVEGIATLWGEFFGPTIPTH